MVWLLLVHSLSAEMRVFIQESNSLAWLSYECTAGETVRAFALDVTVDKGRIVGISNFFRGPCTSSARGYGIFPASFRDHLVVDSGGSVDWNVPAYSPLAVAADNPGATQPGLNSSGVTLEFGALWDLSDPSTAPATSGTLCSLSISEEATVSVAANAARGGVISTEAAAFSPTFTSAVVHPPIPLIAGIGLTNEVLTVIFSGGELQSASTINGPWGGTGNTSGQYNETVTGGSNRFYRVSGP